MTDNVDTVRCTYTYREDGIHEYVLLDTSRAAFDDFLGRTQSISESADPDEVLLNLVDFSNGLPPVMYSFQRSQEAVAKQKKAGHSIPSARNAILYQSGVLISMVQTFVNLLHVDAVGRFFPVEERDQAIAWLLEGRDSSR